MAILVDPNVVGRGFRALFIKAFNNGELDSPFTQLWTKVTSDSADEDYSWLGQVPQLKEWLDERQIKSLAEHNYTLVNKDFEATLGVKRRDIERQKFNAINIRIADIAKRARTHPIKLLFDAIVDGSTTGLGFDGVAFFSASHILGDASAQSNLVSQTGTTDALIQADFETAVAQMESFVDEDSEPINGGENLKFMVVCAPGMKSKIRRALTGDIVGNTSNELQNEIARKDIKSSPRLTGDAWYLFNVGDEIKPFIFQVESEPDFESQTKGERAFMRKEFLYGISYSAVMGYGLWWNGIKVS